MNITVSVSDFPTDKGFAESKEVIQCITYHYCKPFLAILTELLVAIINHLKTIKSN